MNRHARNAILLIMAVCVLVPFFLLVTRAFTDYWSYPDLFPDLSIGSLMKFMDTDRTRDALINSIVLSTLVTFISMVLGLLPAKYLGTKTFKGKTALYIFLLIPAVTPGICIMFGLIEVQIHLGIYRTFFSTLLCQAAFTTPYFIFIMMPVFKRFDTQLEEQSAILGVGKMSTMLNVTLPAVKTGLATSMMLTFVISWSMYLITTVCAPVGYDTMATMLLPQISFGYAFDSYVSSLALIFMIPAILSLVLSSLAVGSDKTNARRSR